MRAPHLDQKFIPDLEFIDGLAFHLRRMSVHQQRSPSDAMRLRGDDGICRRAIARACQRTSYFLWTSCSRSAT